ncbi:tubulin nucleotide-binding domain-like protein [Imleria badia]|nr:tubulin nucleotide-binding domain-like protein [Imleria badia]
MREIIHIQAGSLSNYTGTHFWNTQEDYFVYDGDDISITDYNISFKEGRDKHNQPTLCPRLLAFDQKSNFGTLTRDLHQEEALTWPTTWHGGLVRQEHERIPRSEYHSRLDLEEDDSEQAEPITTKIRYWSDFSRVFFDPKSIQAVPDTPELVEGDWNTSRETFSRYDDNAELMDGSLRLLMEDCNSFQGIQMIQDTSIFGGFSSSFLSAFREDHPKATIMTFACLSSISPLDANIGDSSQIKRVLNDALSLRSVAEFCDLTVPILSPPLWGNNCWFDGHVIDSNSLYQCSAVLSAHIETATLPLRLQGGLDDLQTMVAHLNWRKSSPFAVLRGTLCPEGLSTENLQNIPNLSFHSNGQALFARRDVSRGFSEDEVVVYNAWNKTHELKEPFLMCLNRHVLERHHLPSYPIPTSFPPIFPDARPKVLKMISSLSTSPSTAGQLSRYAHFVESAAKRRDSALLATGLEEDEVRDLVSALWDIVDEYGDNEDGGGDLSEGMGEDEE